MGERSKGVIFTYLYLVVHILVNLLFAPLMLKFIGQSEYGLFQIVGSFMAYLSIFESSISTGVMKFYCAEFDKGKDNDGSNILAIARIIYRYISLAMVILGIVLIFIFRWFYRSSFTASEIQESTWSLVLLLVNLLVTMSNSVYLAAIRAHEKFIIINVLSMINEIMRLVLCVLVASRFPYALTLIAVQLLLNISIAAYRYWYSSERLSIHVKLSNYDRKIAKAILGFSAGILLANLADQIFWKTDQIILGKLYNTAIVAVYAIGVQIYTIYMYTGTSISSVFFPRISQLYSEDSTNKKVSDLFITVGRISAYILLLVLTGFIIFGQEFLLKWVGPGYDDAYWVAVVVMVPFTIDLMQNLGLNILMVMDLYKFRATMYFVSALLNIVLTIVMAYYYSTVGAALSTGISMFITSGVVMNIYYQKRAKLDIKGFWKNISKIALVLFPYAIVSYFINEKLLYTNNILVLILKIIIYTIIYCAISYFLLMNGNEKSMFHNFIVTAHAAK